MCRWKTQLRHTVHCTAQRRALFCASRESKSNKFALVPFLQPKMGKLCETFSSPIEIIAHLTRAWPVLAHIWLNNLWCKLERFLCLEISVPLIENFANEKVPRRERSSRTHRHILVAALYRTVQRKIGTETWAWWWRWHSSLFILLPRAARLLHALFWRPSARARRARSRRVTAERQ